MRVEPPSGRVARRRVAVAVAATAVFAPMAAAFWNFATGVDATAPLAFATGATFVFVTLTTFADE